MIKFMPDFDVKFDLHYTRVNISSKLKLSNSKKKKERT